MSELSALINSAVAERLKADFVEEKINQRVDALVKESIDSALRSYSDTGKMVQKAVEDALKVSELDLPSYGEVITGLLKERIEALVSPIVSGRLAEDMEQLLNLAPKTVKLSKLVEEMVEDRFEYNQEFGDLVTCIIGDSDYGSTWVYLDESTHYEEHEKYRANIAILIRKDGTIAGANFGGKKIEKSIGFRHGLEAKIRAYYACGTIIEIDEQNISTYKDYD